MVGRLIGRVNPFHPGGASGTSILSISMDIIIFGDWLWHWWNIHTLVHAHGFLNFQILIIHFIDILLNLSNSTPQSFIHFFEAS